MKKISIISVVIALGAPTAALAAPYGMAGCGLGSMLFGDGGLQTSAATTNGIVANQSFGITSGTSNCVDNPASASLDPYLVPLGPSLGVDGVVCTVLERGADGRLTGSLVGPNCRGAEKARRVEAWLSERRLADVELWAYGDSAGDDELLALADHPLRVDGVRIHPDPK